MNIKKMITPYNHGAGTIDRIKYIVLHYVGALGSAEANCEYFMTDGRNASAHYFVNHDGAIWQSVEDKDVAWHCKNTNPECKNLNSIGIEMCCSKDENGAWFIPDATVNGARELVKFLMEKYNVPIENVWRHYDCTKKLCPEPWVRNPELWDGFKASLITPHADGWFEECNEWYYYRGGVKLCDEWLEYKKHWYRLGPDGAMLVGWHKVLDRHGVLSWCYFDESEENIGAMWHERSDGNGYLEVWTIADR